jgi:hypothetical protein
MKGFAWIKNVQSAKKHTLRLMLNRNTAVAPAPRKAAKAKQLSAVTDFSFSYLEPIKNLCTS